MVRPPMGRMSMIPSATFIDTRLTAFSRDVLGIIAAHGNTKRDGWCYIYQRNIAELLGASRQKVNAQIQLLVACGYLDKKPNYQKSGAQSYNHYRVRLDYDLPAEHSRLPVAPDDERPDGEHPGNPPLSPQGDTPVTVGLHPRHRRVTPINKDERGNLNGETLTEVTHSPPVLENLPSGERLTREQIRAWPWLYGVPVRSRRLRELHVERATNGYEEAMREDIAAGRVPEFRLWEKAHHWPRGAMPRDTQREREYRTFAAVVGARIAETHPVLMESLAVEV